MTVWWGSTSRPGGRDLGFELLQHQHEGVAFLTGRGVGLLAFEQGLGKTFVAIEAFRRLLDAGQADRLLVICPNSLKRNWVAEFTKFAPSVSVDVAEGVPKKRRATFRESRARVIITSYETARSETTALLALAQRQRTVLVLDESHAAKNWRSQTSAAARIVAPHCKFRWLLSGTPVTNTATDLFTQVEIIEPGRGSLGSLESFTARLEDDPEASFARDVFDRLILRRTKEQCLDLPEKSFVDVRVELPPWQRRLYDKMRDEMVCEIEAMSGEQYRAYASTALAKLTRLVQLACNPSLIFPEAEGTPAKFEALDGVIEDILSVPGRKVILWSNYIRTIETLLARIPGAVAIYGGTPTSERQEIAASFQQDPDVRVLIANPAAAGTGFTLTAASFTIYESLSWRYDHYAQSQDRNHRIGQTEPVTYLRLIAADTIEEAIVVALERKSALARTLLGDEGAGDDVSRLTKEEMCELLRSNRLPAA
ncbi:Helicase domain protein [Polymorphum gilvum SL003B-26A1]|uniref:Helicase domain protein n=1 Tax=Polymorphum gilvum (strain LMG 25793 / CGMCC 1.9160 / SL003B-26A1) TaxID=991905 RepID=F2J5R1_POLGS|nr:Helicase domain protein [Polymorphum gilvum SL003B-26A1]